MTAPGARHDGQSAVDSALGELIGDSRVLVFDEFHAHDAGDTMPIARLFRTPLDRRITLVTTSNHPPAGLMPDPLHHHLFEPTIQLIEERMDVLDGVPPPAEVSADGRQRFANPVDVARDRDIRLVLIGADPLAALPADQALTRDLDRTASRLAMRRRTDRDGRVRPTGT
ncbi:AFG1/ZapE family ATPase [Streptomyces sp. NPDC053513]|uniref:AFG1/ZapE family ATPase n=1 Tax=unclassified Streptomyces TaxID=2593676 RepID=UPI0037CE838B